MEELPLSLHRGKGILMTSLNKISPHDWQIIYSIDSYIEANIDNFLDYADLFSHIEALGVQLEWEKAHDIFLPDNIILILNNIAQKILDEKWDEFSIITGYTREELYDTLKFIKENHCSKIYKK